MSEDFSLGYVRASDWVGVASEMVEFLENLDLTKAPEVRDDTLSDAQEFFRQVARGLDPSSPRLGEATPMMAAISSLTVAVDVLTSLAGSRVKSYDGVRSKIESYVKTLQEIRERKTSTSGVGRLREFFLELWRQGNLARESACFEESEPALPGLFG